VEVAAAVLLDWESWWALELPSKPSAMVTQMSQLESYYAPLFDANVTIDFARPDFDLSRYRLVLVPNLYLVSDQTATNLAEYVRGGGHLVMSFFSGVVDPDEHIRLGGYMQPFRELLGLRVVDWLPMARDAAVEVRFGAGMRGVGTVWSELVELDGAEAVATFAGGPADGRPAVTRNRFGAGEATYLGTRVDPATMARLLADVCSRAGVQPVAEVPPGVEAVRRQARGKSYLFLLNHREAAVDVPLSAAGTNLIDGAQVHPGLLRLHPRGVAVLKEGW
jgi:beta-galactosidase